MKTNELLDIVAAALGRNPGSVTLEDTPDTLEEWDSIGHLSIVSGLEQDAGITPDNDELTSFTSIKQLVETLKANGTLED